MIVPSIDMMGGQVVQLVGGKEKALSAGEPLPLATKFGRTGEVALIDLDAAMTGQSNAEQIKRVLPFAKCRVGGGIRDAKTAIDWLDSGAEKVILGTAATPEILQALPRDRVIAALDAVHDLPTGDGGQSINGEVVDQGWLRKTGKNVVERIHELKDYVDGFLITFVEREGRMTGMDMSTVSQYSQAAGDAKVTVAGGIATSEEIGLLDAMGVDAQVGMALYTDKISLAEGFCSPLKSDRSDGLWPTIVASESGQALGLSYSNLESVDRSLETGMAHYWSRKRGLWKKGATSGATQELLAIDMDCDRDAMRFTVKQNGAGFCHLPQATCFGASIGLAKLEQQLAARLETAPEGSYTRKLFQSPDLLNSKILEEAQELVSAVTRSEIVHEAADVIFFTLTRMAKEGIKLSDVENELRQRALKVTRRAAKVESGGSRIDG